MRIGIAYDLKRDFALDATASRVICRFIMRAPFVPAAPRQSRDAAQGGTSRFPRVPLPVHA